MILKSRAYFFFLLSAVLFICSFTFISRGSDEEMLCYTCDPKSQELKLYLKDNTGKPLGSIQNLKSFVEADHRKLVFAMNGGMYMENQMPLGLFIQQQKTVTRLNTRSGKGNFYMKPNGVFFITTDRQAGICSTEDFKNKSGINYATQSGPLLLINGEIHPDFTKGSANLNIRNGAGILPDGKVIFAMSKSGINFYDLALFFKNKGCKNALYFDGFVSRTYLPEQNWVQTDGNFGVMVGVTEAAKK